VKTVEDYQRFGVVVTDSEGHMTRIVEKPKAPISKRANIRSQMIDPVYIEDGVKIANSKVGPNVSLGAGTIIEHSTLRDTIAGSGCRIVRSKLVYSLIGDDVLVAGVAGEITLGDHSEVRGDER
jgi:glucose-1-phosphate thymidylyltransferase